MEHRKFLQQFNFITLPSKDFSCPVCLSVLQEPFLSTCCGGHFCEKCVQKVKEHLDECPLCKERPLNAVIDKYFKRQLDQLMVYCPQKDCKWTGELGKVNEHLAVDRIAGECQYVNVKCPLSCGFEVQRKLLDSHVTEDCLTVVFLVCTVISKAHIWRLPHTTEISVSIIHVSAQIYALHQLLFATKCQTIYSNAQSKRYLVHFLKWAVQKSCAVNICKNILRRTVLSTNF